MENFEIGTILNRTFLAIKKHFLVFGLTSLLIAGVPQLLLGLLPLAFATDMSGYLAAATVIAGVSAIIMLVAQYILQGALIHASINEFNQETVNFKESLTVTSKKLLPIIGFAILAGLGIMLGLAALIVPGIILMIAWSVGIPVMITENATISESFSRSQFLTKGYRGWIFLLMIIFIVLSLFVGMLIEFFSAFISGGAENMFLGGEINTQYFIVSAIASMIIQTVVMVISSVGTAAVYYQLRLIKEGIAPKSLLAVFE